MVTVAVLAKAVKALACPPAILILASHCTVRRVTLRISGLIRAK